MIRTVAAITLAVSAIATPAFAATDEFNMQIDLNRAQLSTVEGAQAEYDRIRADVHDRCEAEHADFKVVQNFVVTRCENQTMKKVVLLVDDTNFTQVHFASN